MGGGVIYSPLLLNLNVQPRIATATSLYITLFGRFGSTLVYLSIGWIDHWYTSLIGATAAIGIYVAIKILKGIIDKYKRPSVVVFILAIILCISAVAVPIFNTQNMMHEVHNGKSVMTFGDICDSTISKSVYCKIPALF